MKKKVAWIVGIVGALALAVAVLTIAPDLQHVGSANKFNSALKAAHSAGIPATVEELLGPPIPDESNAAIELNKARKILEANKAYFDLLVGDIKKSHDDPTVLPAPFTPEAEQILALCRQASHKPSCSFERNWSNPVRTTFPELPDLKFFAHMLGHDMVIQAEKGNWDTAEQDAVAISKISQYCFSEPFQFGFLLAHTINTMNAKTMQRMVHKTDAHPRSLEIVEKVAGASQPHSIMHYQKGEAFMHIEIAKLLSNKKTSEGAYSVLGFSPPSQSGNALLDLWHKIKRKIDEPSEPYQSSQAVRTAQAAFIVEKATAKYKALSANGDNIDSLNTLLRKLEVDAQRSAKANGAVWKMLSYAPNIADTLRTADAQDALLKGAVEIHRYKAAKGKNPIAGDIVLPTDPFTDKDLILKTFKSGFSLYSLGANRKDDGGRIENSVSREEVDLVYRYRMPDTDFGGR
ncbi:MAG: hypothetical protein KDC26_10520 [Armatimonadetes bacterium]|nr:hypothetical protein [Armatimonadota bacterium]